MELKIAIINIDIMQQFKYENTISGKNVGFDA